jgi:hypothetical protein
VDEQVAQLGRPDVGVSHRRPVASPWSLVGPSRPPAAVSP